MSANAQLEAEKSSSYYPSDADDSSFANVASSSPDIKSEADDSERSEDAVPTPDGAPPNGGLVAWLQVVGAFILFMNSW